MTLCNPILIPCSIIQMWLHKAFLYTTSHMLHYTLLMCAGMM